MPNTVPDPKDSMMKQRATSPDFHPLSLLMDPKKYLVFHTVNEYLGKNKYLMPKNNMKIKFYLVKGTTYKYVPAIR